MNFYSKKNYFAGLGDLNFEKYAIIRQAK